MANAQQGAQSVHRTAHILRVLSTEPGRGMTTTAVANDSGVQRSTAHRILSALQSEGFVDYDRQFGLWFLGPEVFVLGSVAGTRFEITKIAQRVLEELARKTGESAFLTIRRGDETVCLLRREGSFPLRSFVLSEGTRFPLGVASAGLALLAFEKDDFVSQYLARSRLARRFGDGHRTEAVMKRLSETRALGYSVNPGLIVAGSWGMGACVYPGTGTPLYAVSLTGVESRFSPSRQAQLGKMLMESAHYLSGFLQGTSN